MQSQEKRAVFKLLILGIGLVLGLALPAGAAAKGMVVVELFTAQGCPACPPADEILSSYSEKENVLTLSWAVDYWDYAGWHDTFASPVHTTRQETYNRAMGRNGVYTPQMIINGHREAVGSRSEEVRAVIQTGHEDLWVEAEFTGNRRYLTVELEEAELNEAATVEMVWYSSEEIVQIKFGDNRGRTLHYSNVVKGFEILEPWNGSSMSLPVDVAAVRAAGANCVALLIRSATDGAIIGAAKIRLDELDA